MCPHSHHSHFVFCIQEINNHCLPPWNGCTASFIPVSDDSTPHCWQQAATGITHPSIQPSIHPTCWLRREMQSQNQGFPSDRVSGIIYLTDVTVSSETATNATLSSWYRVARVLFLTSWQLREGRGKTFSWLK